MQEQSLKSADLWSGLALAALGVYIIAEAWQWEYLGPDGPGPGFFPLWCGVAMVALSTALVISSVLRPSAGKAVRIDWNKTGRALGTWVALLVSVALFKPLGFLLSFALFTFFIVAVMYRRPFRVAAAVAAAGILAFYLLFPLALGLSVPVGVFGI